MSYHHHIHHAFLGGIGFGIEGVESGLADVTRKGATTKIVKKNSGSYEPYQTTKITKPNLILIYLSSKP
jgi:hypothetical protein